MSLRKRKQCTFGCLLKHLLAIGLAFSVFTSCVPIVDAASPASIAQGSELFQREWAPRNPALGGDGLGPLFNGVSCVACHRQGGVGGAGESEFNAKTIGIERMQITGGRVNAEILANMVRSFHPGFVDPNGSIDNTFTIAHHGGTPTFAASRDLILSQLPSKFSKHGGSTESSEVRQTTATPILFNNRIGAYKIVIKARLFQRNTTPLFGSGLIDQVSDQLIKEQMVVQQRHPEIKGRPSTLKEGRYGKFGWRGNVASLLAFCDQACANEMGLQTRRKQQGADPTAPNYKNASLDITDNQIIAMRDFVAALPAPVRQVPENNQSRAQASRGEAVFAAVGCAVCHVPNMGPAKGVYSDLLLHEMGSELVDLNHAEPYVRRVTRVRNFIETAETREKQREAVARGRYYGRSTPITISGLDREGRLTETRVGTVAIPGRPPAYVPVINRGFLFVAPTRLTKQVELVTVGQQSMIAILPQQTNSLVPKKWLAKSPIAKLEPITVHRRVQVDYEPTNIAYEWRTAPLWGLRDSAPYMHDGRAETVLEAIMMHGGESAGTRDRFLALPLRDREAALAFLYTMVAPSTANKQPRFASNE